MMGEREGVFGGWERETERRFTLEEEKTDKRELEKSKKLNCKGDEKKIEDLGRRKEMRKRKEAKDGVRKKRGNRREDLRIRE